MQTEVRHFSKIQNYYRLLYLRHSITYTEERKLADKERPLIVQLNWGKDDREGRFLLKNEDQSKAVSVVS